MTVSAGRLTWTLDIEKQEQALRQVEALGKKLDQALNKNRGDSGLGKIGREAGQASNRVKTFQASFIRLNVELKTGKITATQYGNSVKGLQGSLQATARQTKLTKDEYRSMNTLLPQLSRAQATLGGTTAEVTAKTRLLVNEVHQLRNNWQQTGQATDQAKARLNALQGEMAEYVTSLRAADGGTVRFGQALRSLNTGMRSAEATVAGMEGRMSRLGLASQVNLGVQQQLTNSLYRLGPAGAVAANSLGIVGGGMGAVSVGALAAGGAIAGVGLTAFALTRRGLPEIRELHNALGVLRASGEDLTESELVSTLQDLQEAAGRAGQQFSRAQIATALAEIVKAGVDAADAMHLLAPGMQLAFVTGQSLNESTSLLLANLRQFGLETTDAARVADALAAADLAAAHGAKELSEGLATVGPVAAAAGFSLEDALAILVELDNKGLDPANVGATAFRGTLAGLLDPTNEAIEVLDGLGVSLRNSDGSARPLREVLYELQEALDGSGESAQEAAKIFDTRAITAMLNLSDQSLELADSLRDSSGALERFVDAFAEGNLTAAEQSLVTAIKDLAASFSGTFADDIATAATNLARFIREVDKLKDQGTLDRIRFIRNLFLPAMPTLDDLGAQFEEGRPPKTRSGARAGSYEEGVFYSGFSNFGPQIPEGGLPKIKQDADDADDAVNDLGDSLKDLEPPPKTVQDVFKDLAADGYEAERAAVAFGNTMDAKIDSANNRAKLIARSINELLVDFGLDPLSAEIQFLVARLAQLEAEVAGFRAEQTQEESDRQAARDAQLRAEQQAREAQARIVGSLADATARGRIAQRESQAAAAEEARIAALVPSDSEVQAAVEAMQRIGTSLGEATIRGMEEAQDRQRQQNQLRGHAARNAPSLVPTVGAVGDILPQDVIASVEAGVRIINSLNNATQAGIADAEAREEAERRLTAAYEARDRILASMQSVDDAADAAEEAARQNQLEAASLEALARITESHANVQEQAEAADAEATRSSRELQAAYEARTRTLRSLNQTTVAGNEAYADSATEMERLQRRIINLQKLGFDPASLAVRELVRQINELQLAAAGKELQEKGLAGLSDFNRQVLAANGILPIATDNVVTFSAKLRDLGQITGNTAAAGLADMLDGVKLIGEAAGDADKLVEGLTLAVEGATTVVEAFAGGDGLSAVRSFLGLAGAGISQIPGMPSGLGGLATGIFDLGASIVQSISDAFTGDSPAARAIREGLTPAVASAFSTGILAALQGQDDWREALEGNVKTAFLGALIDAFVNSAIIGAVLQPLITEFSKLIAGGQYDEARAFLANELPAALDTALKAVDIFAGSIPPGLLPNTGASGRSAGTDPITSPVGTTFLPSALVSSVSAPAWMNEINLSAGRFRDGSEMFATAVEDLVNRGILVRVDTGAGQASAAELAYSGR